MKKLLIAAFCVHSFALLSQNLIQNPSFEVDGKITSSSQLYKANGWSDANGGSVDIFSTNARSSDLGIPDNYAGSQTSEANYAGFTAHYDDQHVSLLQSVLQLEVIGAKGYQYFAEYPQGALSQPLVAGQKYLMTLQVSLSEKSGRAVKGLGVYFSNDQLNGSNNRMLTQKPQVRSEVFASDKSGWVTISGEFTAQGGERFFIIGAFEGTSEAKTIVEERKENDDKRAYYYIKGASLTKVVEKDSDGDGVLDKDDDCPNTPGTLNGCPDKDKDGIADAQDACPEVAGLAELNGCPKEDKDSDGDGVTDSRDECPNEPGTVKGCPDRDKDGVADKDDECPDVRGIAALNGCALSKSELEVIKKASEAIYFNTGSASIKQESYPELDKLADLLKNHPEVEASIEGHTDSQGNDATNLKLSKARAKAVKDYLVSKGVESDHLASEGYGETKPIADNATAEGRAQNRRVVINTSSYVEKAKKK